MSDSTNPQIRTRRRSGSDEALGEFSDLPPARRMGALVTRLERIRRMQTNQMDLGTADLRILWLFADGRSRTLKEISADLNLEQSTVNRQINAAINEGLLQRSRRPGARRGESRRPCTASPPSSVISRSHVPRCRLDSMPSVTTPRTSWAASIAFWTYTKAPCVLAAIQCEG